MRNQVVARIDRLDEGKTFSAKELLDIASRTTIGVTLASLTTKGVGSNAIIFSIEISC